jgi:hypothetical protein
LLLVGLRKEIQEASQSEACFTSAFS